MNDNESGLYYLQSRYYDPKICRFINADSYTSTGQGVLGYNMFAYCANNPVNCYDPYGYTFADVKQKIFDGGAGLVGVGAAGAGLIVIPLAIATYRVTYAILSEIAEFSRSVYDEAARQYDNQQPRIHHVIPKGDFVNRNAETRRQIDHMHALLISADIDIDDPQNLIIISHGSHKSMHTNEYIAAIHSIMSSADMGDKTSIRIALFLARVYASSLDNYPNGY